MLQKKVCHFIKVELESIFNGQPSIKSIHKVSFMTTAIPAEASYFSHVFLAELKKRSSFSVLEFKLLILKIKTDIKKEL